MRHVLAEYIGPFRQHEEAPSGQGLLVHEEVFNHWQTRYAYR